MGQYDNVRINRGSFVVQFLKSLLGERSRNAETFVLFIIYELKTEQTYYEICRSESVKDI